MSVLRQPPLLLAWQIDRDLTRHPRSCTYCRTVERSDMLGNNNHYPMFGERRGYCVAQMLTRNHVTFAMKRVETLRDKEIAAAELTRYIDRATTLWGHRDDTGWLDEARALLATIKPVGAPEHHAVNVGDQLHLFGGAA